MFIQLRYLFSFVLLLSSLGAFSEENHSILEINLSVRKAVGPEFIEPHPSSPYMNQPFSQKKLIKILETTNKIWAPCDIHFTVHSYGEVSVSSAAQLAPDPEEWIQKRDLIYTRIGKTSAPSPIDRFIDNQSKSLAQAEKIAKNIWGTDLSKLFISDGKAMIPVLVVPRSSDIGYGGGFPSETITELSTLSLLEIFSFPTYLTQRTAVPFAHGPGQMILYGFSSSKDDANSGPEFELSHQQIVLAHEIGHFLGLSHEESWENMMYAGLPGPGGRGAKLEPYQCAFVRNYVNSVLLKNEENTKTGENCREHVKNVIEFLDLSNSEVKSNNAVVVQKILDIYDLVPQRLKQAMCEITRIQIDDTIIPGAITQPIWNPNFNVTLKIRADFIRKDFLSIEDYLTWRESVNFGDKQTPVENQKPVDTPKYDFFPRQGANNYLMYLFLHELGHIYDFSHRVQSDWQPWSWNPHHLVSLLPLTLFDFPDRKRLCYFYCRDLGVIADSNGLEEVYKQAFFKEWISPYGSVASTEEFAEVFAYQFLEEYFGVAFNKLNISFPQGKVQYDIDQLHHESKRLRELYNFIRNLK